MSNHQSETNQSDPCGNNFLGNSSFTQGDQHYPETLKKIFWRKAVKKPHTFSNRPISKCVLNTKYGSLGSFVNVFQTFQNRGFPTFCSRWFMWSYWYYYSEGHCTFLSSLCYILPKTLHILVFRFISWRDEKNWGMSNLRKLLPPSRLRISRQKRANEER